MTVFKHVDDYAGSRPDKFFKTTLFEGEYLMAGLNCLEPGQAQPVHDHADQDKLYFVVSGEGSFTVGDATERHGPGTSVWAAAGIPHGVVNEGSERLVLLITMAPPPQK